MGEYREAYSSPTKVLQPGDFCDSCQVLINPKRLQKRANRYARFYVCDFCFNTLVREKKTGHRQFVRSLNDKLGATLSPPIIVIITEEDAVEYAKWVKETRQQLLAERRLKQENKPPKRRRKQKEGHGESDD